MINKLMNINHNRKFFNVWAMETVGFWFHEEEFDSNLELLNEIKKLENLLIGFS